MLGVSIKTIPHKEQRYETVGDWWWEKDGTLQLRVSQMSDWRYEFLVAFHELFEAYWCRWNGVTQADVDAFDLMFEKERKAGKHQEDDEAGDDPRAPYRKGHFMATNLEAVAAFALGVDWKTYEDEVYSL